ncbi:hypothetical protein WN51_01469 [Melipona quadrifasciata]|uniref:Uncharacterized protein n=1 Tax=Melipona quadrifasciata TaxID=166423 RepID=A0A0M8ZW73_9HYME|nr:hypothetical protein WN51_01469 [Melipona quadrifasciata]
MLFWKNLFKKIALPKRREKTLSIKKVLRAIETEANVTEGIRNLTEMLFGRTLDLTGIKLPSHSPHSEPFPRERSPPFLVMNSLKEFLQYFCGASSLSTPQLLGNGIAMEMGTKMGPSAVGCGNLVAAVATVSPLSFNSPSSSSALTRIWVNICSLIQRPRSIFINLDTSSALSMTDWKVPDCTLQFFQPSMMPRAKELRQHNELSATVSLPISSITGE